MTLAEESGWSAQPWVPAIAAFACGLAIGGVLLVVAPALSVETNYVRRIYQYMPVLLVIVALASTAGTFVLGKKPLQWILLIAMGVTCAHEVRIQIDQSHDRSTHNLLPFELAMVFVEVLIAAAVGAAIGYVSRRAAERVSDDGDYEPPWKRGQPPRT